METILAELMKKYEKYLLSRKEILEILNISSSTFNNIITTNHLYKLPPFRTVSYSKKSFYQHKGITKDKNYELYQFNIYDVAEFLQEKEANSGK